jgi:hypothetical protein
VLLAFQVTAGIDKFQRMDGVIGGNMFVWLILEMGGSRTGDV